MTSVRLRKIRADLREHRRRVLLAVVAMAVGTTALATTFSARAVLSREIDASFRASRPASATLWTDDVDEDLLARVRGLPGVRDADARRLVRARVRVAEGEWLPLSLYGVRDFSDLRVSTFRAITGAFPPRDGEVLVEQSAVGVLNTAVGQELHVRVPGGATGTLRVGGLVHDPGQAPGWQDHVGYAYASRATLHALGLGPQLHELRIIVDGDQEEAKRVAGSVGAWLTAQGRPLERTEVHAVGHPHAEHMNVIVTLLATFAALALVLAASLAATVVSSMLARQVREIGAMKTIGASTSQVAAIYAGFILVLAGAGVALGLPVGMLLAHRASSFSAYLLNLEFQSLAVPATTVLIELAAGIGVPLLAAAFPVLRAARITVREAIQFVGLSPGRMVPVSASARHGIERRLVWRNLWRRPVRLAANLSALALGGAALMTAVNVHGGLIALVDAALAARGDDIDVRLLRPAPLAELERAVHGVPDVVYAESWGMALASLDLGQTGGGAIGTSRYVVSAPPRSSRMQRPRLVEGRWFAQASAGEAVVNRGLTSKEPSVRIGAEVALLTPGRSTPVRVVGIVEELGAPGGLYVAPETMSSLIGRDDVAGALRVVVAPGKQAPVAAAIEEMLVDRGWFPLSVVTRDALRLAMIDHFVPMFLLLVSAALAALTVGGLSLATSIGLSVLERSREIGVMRAIGASDQRVRRMLFLEGATLCAGSGLLAFVIAAPLTAIVQAIIGGEHSLQVSIPFSLSPWAPVAWMLAALLVMVVACMLPARRALLAPVREVLAHE